MVKTLRTNVDLLEDECAALFADHSMVIGKHSEKLFNNTLGCSCTKPEETCPFKKVQEGCIKLIMDAQFRTEKPAIPDGLS